MFSFLLGFGAGLSILLNPKAVQRGIARLLVQGEEIATDVAHQARRYAAEVTEDFQDAYAQAQLERSEEKERIAARNLMEAEMQLLRLELAALRAELAPPAAAPDSPSHGFEPLRFQNISREQFDALAANLKPMGLEMQSDSGAVARDGVNVSWSYNPIQKSLAIKFRELPPYLPFQVLTRKIQEIVTCS